MTKFEDLDLAKVLPCQECGTPTRMMNVPIAGAGLDLVYPDKTTCKACLLAKVVAAANPVRHKIAPGRKVILTP